MQITQQDVEAVIEVARAAGELVLEMQRAGLRNIKSKSSVGDIVTEADVASERLIRSRLEALYPSVALWGEESNQMPAGGYFWLVDPIDGTTNYAAGIDYNAVNIALQNGEETLLGVTYQTHMHRVFYARPGEGAYRREANGEEVQLLVNGAATLSSAVFASGFPYHSGTSSDNNSAEFAYVLARCAGLRVLGAAALDLAHVAGGGLAGFWEGWLMPWDAAPGALLVREAGGRVTNYGGQPWTIRSRDLVSTNGQPGVHDELLAAIRTARQGLSD